jgi:hypothetical protein
MKKALPLFFCLVVTWGCAARLAEMSAEKRAERLATERGRLADLSDPVERTKSYITISEILLSFASEALRDGAIADMKTLMGQYITAVESARDAMADSNRDAERRPSGFKELEIAMRGQLRRLEDMRRQLVVDERKPVDDAIAVAGAIRDEMLRHLFPQGKPAAVGN